MAIIETTKKSAKPAKPAKKSAKPAKPAKKSAKPAKKSAKKSAKPTDPTILRGVPERQAIIVGYIRLVIAGGQDYSIQYRRRLAGERSGTGSQTNFHSLKNEAGRCYTAYQVNKTGGLSWYIKSRAIMGYLADRQMSLDEFFGVDGIRAKSVSHCFDLRVYITRDTPAVRDILRILLELHYQYHSQPAS